MKMYKILTPGGSTLYTIYAFNELDAADRYSNYEYQNKASLVHVEANKYRGCEAGDIFHVVEV